MRDLAEQLEERYGRGFSGTNLRYFRLFYQVYADRSPEIRHESRDESGTAAKRVLDDLETAVKGEDSREGFSPALSWSHYRTLCKVENRAERLFYEIEAGKCNWS